jgi:tetratricopeptide (TPR) repeat protein
MKKIITLLFCFTAVYANSQDTAALKKHYQKIYSQALYYNDINAATNALHGYLSVDNNMLYKDTLSMLYFKSKSYVSALILSEEVAKAMPANMPALARNAACYDELGDPKTAIGLYEQVVTKTKDPYNTYKLAVCQYQLKRVAECMASAKTVLTDTSSKNIGVAFTFGNGDQQAVPVSAAALNLLGVLKMEAKDFAGAKADFKQAVAQFPDFVGAKENLEVCERNIKPVTKPAAKKPK